MNYGDKIVSSKISAGSVSDVQLYGLKIAIPERPGS
jgi:hypothetical protein